MYGKIFESIFDSTLAAEGGWMPTYIFMSMVVLADKEGVVDVAPKALYRRLGFSDYDSKIAYQDFIAALDYLQQEDCSSRSPEQNGKRIIPLSEIADFDGNRGFIIVNYSYYRDKGGSLDQRRTKDAERKRRQRARKNNSSESATSRTSRDSHVTVTDGHGESAHTDTDTNTDTDKPTTAPSVPPEFAQLKKIYPKRSGSQPWSRALKAINARLKEGSQWAEILEGAERYAIYSYSVGKTGTEYVMQAATFCGSEKHFLELWQPPGNKSDRLQDKNIAAGQSWLGEPSG